MHFIRCLRGDRVVLAVMEAAVDALPDGGDRLSKGGLGSAILVGLQCQSNIRTLFGNCHNQKILQYFAINNFM